MASRSIYIVEWSGIYTIGIPNIFCIISCLNIVHNFQNHVNETQQHTLFSFYQITRIFVWQLFIYTFVFDLIPALNKCVYNEVYRYDLSSYKDVCVSKVCVFQYDLLLLIVTFKIIY